MTAQVEQTEEREYLWILISGGFLIGASLLLFAPMLLLG